MRHIMSFFGQSEMGTEAKAVFAELGKQDYVAEYQKYTICSYLTEVIKRGDFYEPEVFPEHNEEMRAVLDGQGEPSPYRQIRLNQNALAVNMPDVDVYKRQGLTIWTPWRCTWRWRSASSPTRSGRWKI